MPGHQIPEHGNQLTKSPVEEDAEGCRSGEQVRAAGRSQQTHLSWQASCWPGKQGDGPGGRGRTVEEDAG